MNALTDRDRELADSLASEYFDRLERSEHYTHTHVSAFYRSDCCGAPMIAGKRTEFACYECGRSCDPKSTFFPARLGGRGGWDPGKNGGPAGGDNEPAEQLMYVSETISTNTGAQDQRAVEDLEAISRLLPIFSKPSRLTRRAWDSRLWAWRCWLRSGSLPPEARESWLDECRGIAVRRHFRHNAKPRRKSGLVGLAERIWGEV